MQARQAARAHRGTRTSPTSHLALSCPHVAGLQHAPGQARSPDRQQPQVRPPGDAPRHVQQQRCGACEAVCPGPAFQSVAWPVTSSRFADIESRAVHSPRAASSCARTWRGRGQVEGTRNDESTFPASCIVAPVIMMICIVFPLHILTHMRSRLATLLPSAYRVHRADARQGSAGEEPAQTRESQTRLTCYAPSIELRKFDGPASDAFSMASPAPLGQARARGRRQRCCRTRRAVTRGNTPA